jgi:hypothetical protein
MAVQERHRRVFYTCGAMKILSSDFPVHDFVKRAVRYALAGICGIMRGFKT